MKVAVLGTGSIGMRHLDILKQIEGAEPIAIPKRLKRAEDLKRSGFLVAPTLQAAKELGAACCIIATDTSCHVEDGCAALELGMDLLIEKPIAIDVLSAQSLLQAAQKKNRKLFVGCVLRFSDSLIMFREWLPKIGKVHSVHIECRSYLPDWRPDRSYKESYSARLNEGGVLRDLIHEIDYAGWIFGWPSFVTASLRNSGQLNIETEEMADLFWETENGTFVSVSLDYLTRIPFRAMSAHGEKGSIEWDGVQWKTTLYIPGAPAEIFISSQTRDELFLAQDRAFIQCHLGAMHSHIADAKDGIKALSICDTARVASQNGAKTKINYQEERT